MGRDWCSVGITEEQGIHCANLTCTSCFPPSPLLLLLSAMGSHARVLISLNVNFVSVSCFRWYFFTDAQISGYK